MTSYVGDGRANPSRRHRLGELFHIGIRQFESR